MKSLQKPKSVRSRYSRLRKDGFALVVTLSLMILLTVIAVGLLSLSAISLRSSSQGLAQAQAQNNARMALMFAIGELQKNAGQDTRITAPANIVDPNSPMLTGVWKSWEGSDHEANGSPVAPSYDSKKQPESGGGRFMNCGRNRRYRRPPAQIRT